MDLREALQKETVATVGYRDLVAIETSAKVRDAVAVMQRSKVGCLVVVEDGELRGIFTERDLVVRVLAKGVGLDGDLRDVMTPDPFVARIDEPIHLVLAKMREKGLRHLPVLDAGGRPVGTISIKRAVHFLSAHLPQAIYNLPPEPDQFPARAEGG